MLRRHDIVCWACCFTIIAGGVGLASALRRPAKFAPAPVGECLAATSALAGNAGAPTPSLPKLRIRAGNRHLIEDENGKPFFMAGVCPQSILHWCTPEQMDVYFADREKRHFNFAWVVINAFDSQGKDSLTNPTDARGHAMLLHGASWDPENLNPDYVASVDAMVKSAADHGIYLFLDPFSSGYDPGPAGFDPSQHSPEEMRRWGEFWGNRYKHYSHLNFALGNDRLVWPQVDRVVNGLEKYMPDRLVTTDWENGPPGWTSDGTGPHRFYDAGHRWVNLDAWYEYHAPQWATWYHYHMANPVMPTCIFETLYEGLAAGSPQHIRTPPQMMREQVWGTVLNGGSGFGILGSPDCTEDPLRWLGKTPGVNAAEYGYDLLHRPALVRTHSRLDAHVSDEPIGNSGEGRFHLRFRGAYRGWLPGRVLLPRRERHEVPVDRQHVEAGGRRWGVAGTLVRPHERHLPDHRQDGELGCSRLHHSQRE